MTFTEIIATDWRMVQKAFLKQAAVVPVAVLVSAIWLPAASRGILYFAPIFVPWIATNFCFVVPLQSGKVYKMLNPATPTQWVLASYAASFSMGFCLINITGWMVRDSAFLFHVNAAMLLLTTLCGAASIIAPIPQAPFVVAALAFGANDWAQIVPFLRGPHDWIATHLDTASICALAIVPVVIYGSVLVFLRAVENGELEDNPKAERRKSHV